MGSRLEAIKESAWSKIDSGVGFLERHGRNIVLGAGVTVAAGAGGVAVFEGARVLDLSYQINHAKPAEVGQLQERQREDFGILYGSTIVALMGAYTALNMHLLNQGYLFWHSPFPIGRINPDQGTLFQAGKASQGPAQNSDKK